jgi:hypothetical protein
MQDIGRTAVTVVLANAPMICAKGQPWYAEPTLLLLYLPVKRAGKKDCIALRPELDWVIGLGFEHGQILCRPGMRHVMLIDRNRSERENRAAEAL